MKRQLIILLCGLFNLAVFGQVSFKCVAYYEETHEPIENVLMQLICTDFSSKTIIIDTLSDRTDTKGHFNFSTKKYDRYELICKDSRYRLDRMRVELADTSKLVIYYLADPGFRDYFPEFLFNFNSNIPQDTSLFMAWDLNSYNNPERKIQITGYYAPTEKKSIGKKRAEAVLKGLIDLGANKDSFTIDTEVLSEIKLNYGHYIAYNGINYFFKKGLTIDSAYIKTQTGDSKEAAMQLLRAVRLQWLSK